MSTWGDIAYNTAGLKKVRHAILTYQGSWSAPGTGYASQVAQALPDLCFEVPSDEPATFGVLSPGQPTAPSYDQSCEIAENWTAQWLAAHPNQTWGVGGYSQGGEAASRVQMATMAGGPLEAYAGNFIGGYTFGNPCRGKGFHAPTIADPGGRGISSVNMAILPTINGQQVWADYVHSHANGDAGLDMYASVPLGQVGNDMTDVYTLAVQQQLNNPGVFIEQISTDLIKVVVDSGVLPSITGGLPGLLALGTGALIEFLVALIAPNMDVSNATGPTAAVLAAVQGLNFVAAPGGSTAPHISYNGEIGGYSNQVADAVSFLEHICTLTPARA